MIHETYELKIQECCSVPLDSTVNPVFPFHFKYVDLRFECDSFVIDLHTHRSTVRAQRTFCSRQTAELAVKNRVNLRWHESEGIAAKHASVFLLSLLRRFGTIATVHGFFVYTRAAR